MTEQYTENVLKYDILSTILPKMDLEPIYPINNWLLDSLTSLDISEVNTVWTWGGQTSISKYFNKKGFRAGFERLTYRMIA